MKELRRLGYEIRIKPCECWGKMIKENYTTDGIQHLCGHGNHFRWMTSEPEEIDDKFVEWNEDANTVTIKSTIT